MASQECAAPLPRMNELRRAPSAPLPKFLPSLLFFLPTKTMLQHPEPKVIKIGVCK